jgi:hypothetical protein
VKVEYSSFALLNIILIITLSASVYGSVYNMYYGEALPISCETPRVILESGTVGASFIYANSTGAKVSVAAPCNASSTYDYVLKIVNQVTDNWTVNLQVYNSSRIDRLLSLNISLYDGISSNQITVSGGNITESEGEAYNLPGGVNSTIYISMSDLQANTPDTSYLYVYLKIKVPNTSTYNLFIVTFEIT